MAELLGAQNGIGNAIFITRSYLETDKLFAWTITLIMLVAIMETLVFNPCTNTRRNGRPDLPGKWRDVF